MCGIAGIISNKYKIGSIQKEAIQRMIHALVHRGPDGQGEFEDDYLVMGMRRLSIIDLAGGWQPLFNENKTLVLIANGEIYNYIELTEGLKNKGHVFATHSDCEPILHLYEEYGADCVKHLRGMFAFALYDKRNRTVLLARDRMGEKPLYYFEGREGLIFSSEMKSLLSSGLVPFEFDPISVDQYFHYQYVPEPRTPLKNIRKLPAGHYMILDLKRPSIQKTCYWRMEDAAPVEGKPADLIREELEKISALILRSDVPVGVALSGGLDSSAIAALAVKKYPGIMHAFSVGYTGRPANDERNDAKALSAHLKMPIHEIELAASELVDIFEDMNFMRDDPIADISGFGYYAVSREARRKGVPVLLQGQGGDELFWGYPWVKDAVIKTEDLRNSSFVRKAYTHGECGTQVYLPHKRRGLRDLIFSLGKRSYISDEGGFGGRKKYKPLFYELSSDFSMALGSIRDYYTSPFLESLGDSSPLDVYTFPMPWQYTDVRITRLISETYLLENGMAQGDRLSMANSVELRLPFVDYKLTELIIGLRKTYRERQDYKDFPKPWLRGAVCDILPDWVINRPKQGFAPPVQEWHTEIFKRFGHHLKDGHLVNAGVLSQEAGRVLSVGPFPCGAIAPISFKALVMELWSRKMLQLLK